MSGGEILLIFGTIVSAMGQLQASANAQQAANANAQNLFNAANAERMIAAENAKRQQRLNVKAQGANRALDPDKLDLLEDSAIEGALAVEDIRFAGDIKAVGLENRAQAAIFRGQQARSQAMFGAASSLLLGGGLALGGNLAPLAATTSVGTVGTPLDFNFGIQRV